MKHLAFLLPLLIAIGCRKSVPTVQPTPVPAQATPAPVAAVVDDSIRARRWLALALPEVRVVQALAVPLPGGQALAVGLVGRPGEAGKLELVRADSALTGWSARRLAETGPLYGPSLALVPDLDGDGLTELLLEERSDGTGMVSVTLTLIDLASDGAMTADGFLGDPVRTGEAPVEITATDRLPADKRAAFQRYLRRRMVELQSRVGLALTDPSASAHIQS